MPYVLKWVAHKKNLKLEVFKELPPSFIEVDSRFILSRQYRFATVGGEQFAHPDNSFYFCPECDGWIKGAVNENEVNTLDGRRLAGRRGTEYNCARCGHELGFFGMVS